MLCGVEKRQRIARTAVDLIRAIAEEPPEPAPEPDLDPLLPPQRPGLRERKKQQTREAISDIATGLFIDRGFEPVTLAEIAEAAQVSVKTIFNYFGSKEELFFDRADDVLAELRRTITEREAGRTITEAFRLRMLGGATPLSDTSWAWLEKPEAYARFRAYRQAELDSPALTARRLVIAEQWIGALAITLREELGLESEPKVDGWAAMLIAAFSLRDRVLTNGLTKQLSGAEIRANVEVMVNDVMARLATAYADLDRPR